MTPAAAGPTPAPPWAPELARPAAPGWWQHLAFWAAVAAPLGAVAALGAASVEAWALIDVALLIVVAVYAVAAAWGGTGPGWAPLLWPALGYAALVFWQWRWDHTAYPAATLTGLLQLAGCGAELYLALAAFRRRRRLRRLGTILWVFTGILAAEALAQYFTAGGRIYWYRDASYATPVGPFIYHNHFAGCMDLLLPVAVAVAFFVRRRRHDTRTLAVLRRGIWPALGLAAVVISQSRGGFFALLVEIGLTGILFWPDLRRSRRWRRTAAWAAAGLIAVTLLAGWGPLLRRLGNLSQHDVSALDRLKVSETCLTIWRTHPWTGTGFNTFATVYPRFQTFDSGARFLEAHNEYAQALAETGLAGVGLAAVFLILLAWRVLRPPPGLSPRALALRKAMFIGVLGFLFHSFGDFQFHSPANALLFFLLAGALAAGEGLGGWPPRHAPVEPSETTA